MQVGSGTTWRIPLDRAGVTVPTQPVFVLKLASFFIEAHGDPDSNPYYATTSSIFTSNVLCYKYIFNNTQCWRFSRRICKTFTPRQLDKLNPEDRRELIGSGYPRPFYTYQLKFEKPEGWEYLDKWSLWCLVGKMKMRKLEWDHRRLRMLFEYIRWSRIYALGSHCVM
jgi:hypothetical protein